MEVGIDRVTVWACRSTVASLPERPWLTARSPRWTEARLPLRLIAQQFLLPGEIARAKCDVLFSPGGTLLTGTRLPSITLSQNLLPFEPLEARRFGRFSAMRFKMRLLRESQSRSFRHADGVIFLSRYAQSVVSRQVNGGLGATALVPHGIEPRFLQPPRPQRAYADFTWAAPFRVLYVSILMPYKHQSEVARAASLLRSEGLPIEVQFIGAGWKGCGPRFRRLLEDLDPKHEYLHWSGAEPFPIRCTGITSRRTPACLPPAAKICPTSSSKPWPRECRSPVPTAGQCPKSWRMPGCTLTRRTRSASRKPCGSWR